LKSLYKKRSGGWTCCM